MLSDNDWTMICAVLLIAVIFHKCYQRKETMDFGEYVNEYPFHPRRKVATKYKWNHGCYGRDYGCYDPHNCKYGKCNKKCAGVCRRPFLTKNNQKKVYHTNCYDKPTIESFGDLDHQNPIESFGDVDHQNSIESFGDVDHQNSIESFVYEQNEPVIESMGNINNYDNSQDNYGIESFTV
jgi:hypothetical protein